jgi:hypothetical protein
MPMVGDFQILYRGELQAPAWAIAEQHHVDIFIDPVEDYSNNTTIGIVTYDISATGVMSFQTTESQAEAIVGSQVITLNSFSGEVAIQAI